MHSHAALKNKRAWVVAVDMGYGHERAAYALRDLAGPQGYLIANNYPGIPREDKRMWHEGKSVYETISRLKPLPVIGPYVFEVLDSLQRIPQFYPRRDLSAPSLQVRQTYTLIEKRGLGRDLVEKLREHPDRPLVSTFFLPAFAAEIYDYPNDIYVVVCDADMSRAWVAKDPKKSRIKYFASNGRVVERLKLYGVPEKHIFLTGFPMPKELIGGPSSSIIKRDLGNRLCNLDPSGAFRLRYAETLDLFLGKTYCPAKADHPLTITFCVGGAGAQKQLGINICKSLRRRLKHHEVQINLVAGVRPEVARFFKDEVKALGLGKELGKSVKVLLADDRPSYFREFTQLLRTTDLLWTKPSELSFYTGLGIPVIMAPSVGSQEDFNRLWLQQVGGGVSQNDERFTDEWLFDWLQSGGLARMAWNGFIEAPTHGTYRIEDVIFKRKSELEAPSMIV